MAVLNNAAVTSASKKREMIALSTMEDINKISISFFVWKGSLLATQAMATVGVPTRRTNTCVWGQQGIPCPLFISTNNPHVKTHPHHSLLDIWEIRRQGNLLQVHGIGGKCSRCVNQSTLQTGIRGATEEDGTAEACAGVEDWKVIVAFHFIKSTFWSLLTCSFSELSFFWTCSSMSLDCL